jgi:hypothetical protein
MAVIKRVLCPQRLRQVPKQFSWIDHRLVRDRHIVGRTAGALSLYLFLVTVADGSGLSYYSDQGICQLLPLDGAALAAARRELLAAGLIAYQKPLYQVLALDAPAPGGPGPGGPGSGPGPRRGVSRPMSIGQILAGLERAL